MLNTRTYVAGLVVQLALLLAPAPAAGAEEPRVDLLVCADRAAKSFRVIEVVYESMQPVPCFTYLSKEQRDADDDSAESEQVAWARQSPGVCERSAQRLRRRFERQGYWCLAHEADPLVARKRIEARSQPPVVINMLGKQLVAELEKPSVFVAAGDVSAEPSLGSRSIFRPSGATDLATQAFLANVAEERAAPQNRQNKTD